MLKIGYFSPFSPDPSGIADFSEELIMKLKDYIEIDIFSRVYPENIEIKKNFKFYNFQDIENENIRQSYDYLLYQVGNNIKYHKGVIDTFMKYSGVLELHDFSLHHYLAEDTFVRNELDKYIEIMSYCHGKKGETAAKEFLAGHTRAPWENRSNEFTVNKHLIDNAMAVIVHSDMAKQMVKGIRSDVPVINIPLHTTDILEEYIIYKNECREKKRIPQDIIVMGSFGYATGAKRILQILEALSMYKKNKRKKFLYYIVGQVEHINVMGKVKELGLEENVIITGFTSIDDFKIYMGACDFCFNLRYPTQGESSASLHRMLGMGKPILVTDVGSFEEYPDDIVIKIRYDNNEILDIYEAINTLVEDKEILITRSQRAYLYAKNNCDIDKNSKRYVNFLVDLKKGRVEEEYIDSVLDRIYDLKISGCEYISDFLKEHKDFMEILSELY